MPASSEWPEDTARTYSQPYGSHAHKALEKLRYAYETLCSMRTVIQACNQNVGDRHCSDDNEHVSD